MKKKLFTTVRGGRKNNHGLVLVPRGNSRVDLLHEKEFIASWDLTESLHKADQVILVEAKSRGQTNSKTEQFHYVHARLLDGLYSLEYLVRKGFLAIDFCIDQEVGSNRAPHDRGPHIRLYRSKVDRAYQRVEVLM